MQWKIHLIIISILLWIATNSYAQTPNPLGQTIQIYTHFTSPIHKKPTWLLELRDIDSGAVFPYIYDVRDQDNFWIALSFGRNYKIIKSMIRFFPTERTINNFCLLEGHVLKSESLFITLTGNLTPDATTSTCSVSKYKDAQFYIATPQS